MVVTIVRIDERERRESSMTDDNFGMFDNTNHVVASGSGDSVQDAFVEGSHLWSLLVVGYSLVFTVGVIGNVVLLAALCGTGSRARALPVRNHLMVNLAAADLLVTAICVPISACAAASHACWPGFLVSWMCQLGPLLQRTPVAASTLSLALLSLDRWAAIRHPRFAQRFRDRRFVAMSMVIIWILASLVAAPTVWARQWNENPVWTAAQQTAPMMELDRANSSGWEQWSQSGVCVERWTNVGIQVAYAATYLGTAFVSPALIVAACHASVSHKLTAQLQVLSSGASSGDRLASRPRPKQVIIVARDPSNNIIPNPLNPGIVEASHHQPGECLTKPNGSATSLDTPNGTADNNNGKNNGSTVSFTKRNSLGVVVCGNGGGGGNGAAVNAPASAGITDHHHHPKPSRKLVPCDPNSDDDDVYIRMQIEADLESFRQLSQLQHSHNNVSQGSYRGVKSLATPRSGRLSNVSVNVGGGGGHKNSTLRAARRETSIIRAHRKLRKKLASSSTASHHHGLSLGKAPPPLLPTYSSQSFRSRRRAANLLAALAGVFVFCWAPYVACALMEMFITEKSLVRLLIPFALFLGHAHSAINPVVSWRLNRSAFVRFQRHTFLSFLPNWNIFRSCRTCTATCCGCCVYSLRNPCTFCCSGRGFPGSTSGGSSNNERGGGGAGTIYLQHNYQRGTGPTAGTGSTRFLSVPNHLTVPSPHNRHGTGYQQQRGRGHQHHIAPHSPSESSCSCFKRSSDYPRGVTGRSSQDDEEGIPCCCCFCPAGGPFGRRSSSPDPWNWNNSSTNEAALGAFHPRYLSRLPVPQPDQISKCHTSHFLR